MGRGLWLAGLLAAAATSAAAAIDPMLVGTWDARGTVMTSSMQKSGAFLLRIGADGRYLLVSSGDGDFVADTGRFASASAGGYVRVTATGLEDRGSYARAAGGLTLRSFYGEFAARPAPAGAGEPALTRLATLLRVAPGADVAGWVARGAQYAELWARDARLEYVSVTEPDADGRLGPRSTATVGFYSPLRNRFLTLSPTRTGSGAMVAFTAPRSGQILGPRGIPVPIVDLATLVRQMRKGGFAGRYATADLRFYGDTPSKSRLLWLARLEGGAGLRRHCLDAARGAVVDCNRFAGDPAAELDALGRRATAAWAAMQRRWSSGDASATSMELPPPSSFDQCGMMGGTMRDGTTCIGGGGDRLPVN
jgi:hypothetical protein